MPRGRKKKFKLDFNINHSVLRSILAILLLLTAIVSLISFFAPNYAINEKIQQVLRVGFGYPSIVFPFVLGIFGLMLMESIKWKVKEPRVFIGMVTLLLSSCGLIQVFFDRADAFDGKGGGVVGFKLLDILSQLISVYGAFVVFFAGIIVSLTLISNVSLDQIIAFISQKLAALKLPAFTFFNFGAKPAHSKVEISSGASRSGIAFEEDLDEQSVPVFKEAASFEIVPSLAEPQDKVLTESVGDGKNVGKLSPALPYTDKVWELPPLDLLMEPSNIQPDRGDVEGRAKIIVDTLKSFGITARVENIQPGPSVTQYQLEVETGTKISKISNLQYDLALALSSPTGSVRIEAPIPGKALIGIEVPNNTRAQINIKSLLSSDTMKAAKSKLTIVLGKDVGGQTLCYEIGKMPHMLIAGATGSGKSMFIQTILFSILFKASPQEVKFILIDPKRVELVNYADIPHLFAPVVTEIDKAAAVFRWAVEEMERRYKLFETARVRNVEAYNEKSGFQALPYIVIICDELAEIMVADPTSVEKSIIRIAQLARATGIHLVLAVQRPSTNIITGLIKANIPCRVAFNVASQIDSRVIIDQPGAEKLLGKGDMLFVPPDIPKPMRLQGAFVDDREINNLVNNLKSRGVAPDYRSEIFNAATIDKARSVVAGGEAVDPLFDQAIDIVTTAGKASASLLQRKLSIGYSRAARIIDELEQKGIISTGNGSKPREVLMGGAEGFGLADYVPETDLGFTSDNPM